MRKISKIVQCLVISGVFMAAGIQKAESFGFYPPMPPDIEFDGPVNATKVVSVGKALYRQAQTIKSDLNTESLQAIKKGGGLNFKNLKGLIPGFEKKGEQKTPGRSAIEASAELGITAGSLDEEELFNAYHTLFFVYPPENSVKDSKGETIKFPVLKTAYKQKSVDYFQDTIMDAYLTSRLTEDYLVAVERTIDRLDMCQKGEMEGSDCVFFGLQMVKVESLPSAPTDPDTSDNGGQLGEAMNAYIVTAVYDRLLRIVEDLTAVEAQYRAAKQINLVNPITQDEQSSAEEYIHNPFRFAYSTVHEFAHAKMLGGSYKRSSACSSGGNGLDCPELNKDATELTNIDNTELLGKIQPIEDRLSDALELHNLKVQLPEYKSLYRKYLKSVEIHERALAVLKQSDSCVVDFLNRHGSGGENLWYGGSKPAQANDYESRQGISRELITKFQEYTTDTLIGTSSECDGYYEAGSCPAGYVTDKENPCAENPAMFPCIVETVAYDASNAPEEPVIESSYDAAGVSQMSKLGYADNDNIYNDADFLMNSNQAEEIDTESRKKAERSWRIGQEKIMELTQNGTLVFAPWNDQQSLQSEYLRNKYRNIRMIIKAVDQGVNSYKIAEALAKNYVAPVEPAEKVVTAITSCVTVKDSVELAHQKYCSAYSGSNGSYKKTVATSYQVRVSKTCTDADGGSYDCSYWDPRSGSMQVDCIITPHEETGFLDVKRYEYKSGTKNEQYLAQSKTIDQRISASPICEFQKAPTNIGQILRNSVSGCPGTWNLSVTFLVQKFFPAALGKCASDPAEQVYTDAKAEGRIVASDKFNNVIDTRIAQEADMKAFIATETAQIKAAQINLRNMISRITGINERIDAATETKNEATQEKQRSERRITSINTEIKELENRIEQMKDLLAEKPNLTKDVSALEEKIQSLKDEQTFLDTGNDTGESTREKMAQTTDAYIPLPDSEKIIEAQDKIITYNKDNLAVLNDDIKKKQDDLSEMIGDFTERYIEQATKMQTAIEEANKEFEDFIETQDGGDQPYRMRDGSNIVCYKWGALGITCKEEGPKRYESDDLETTTIVFLYPANNMQLAAQKGMEETWFKTGFESAVAAKLRSYGVPSLFVVADSSLVEFGLNAGQQTPMSLAISLKKKAVELASIAVASITTESDEAIKLEVKAAVDEINAVMEELGVTGENGTTAKPFIFEHNQYEDYGSEGAHKVTNMHTALIEALRTPENAALMSQAGIDLNEIFGIPEEIVTDEEYFVALPARGNVYRNKSASDTNAGRDYMSPKGPLLNLAPLREVFYYSSLDYDDTPKDKKKKKDKQYTPSIAHLLDLKYNDAEDKLEYLPETWRYLLARPNLRSDGKYQQTFVERSMGDSQLKKLIDNIDNPKIPNAKIEHYRAIIGRAGSYPCKLGSRVIDVGGGDGVNNMAFKISSNAAAKAGAIYTCKEVEAYKSGVNQLLADSGKDYQKSLSGTNEPMYEKYSELGQFLSGDLKFRPLQQNIHEYLLDTSHTENNIERQRADLASFKRNVMGNFLDNVNTEHNAKKMMDNAKEDIVSALKSLCSQIHNFGQTVGGGDEETDEACAEYIMEHGGLAKSSADNDYDNIKCSKASSTQSSFYNQIFCKLEEWKNKAINDAQKGYTGSEGDVYEGYSVIKNDKDAYRVQERLDGIQDSIDVLEFDKNEEQYITPGSNLQTVNSETLKQARADRESSRAAEEEGISSMDNQTRVVPYCPVY